jgi:hypothetical protein
MAPNPAQPRFSLSTPKPRPISLPATMGPLFIVPVFMFGNEFMTTKAQLWGPCGRTAEHRRGCTQEGPDGGDPGKRRSRQRGDLEIRRVVVRQNG